MLLHKNLLIVVGAATLGFATLSSVRPVEASVLFDEIGTLNPFNTQRDGDTRLTNKQLSHLSLSSTLCLLPGTSSS
jgi:hypothetical protein